MELEREERMPTTIKRQGIKKAWPHEPSKIHSSENGQTSDYLRAGRRARTMRRRCPGCGCPAEPMLKPPPPSGKDPALLDGKEGPPPKPDAFPAAPNAGALPGAPNPGTPLGAPNEGALLGAPNAGVLPDAPNPGALPDAPNAGVLLGPPNAEAPP